MIKNDDVKFKYMALDLTHLDLRLVTLDGKDSFTYHVSPRISIYFGELREGNRPFFPAIFLQGRALHDDEFYLEYETRQSYHRTNRAMKDPSLISASLTDEEINKLMDKLSGGTIVSRDIVFIERRTRERPKDFKTRSSVFLSDESWKDIRKLYRKLEVQCVIKGVEGEEDQIGRDYRAYLEEEFEARAEGDYGEEILKNKVLEEKKKEDKKVITTVGLIAIVTLALGKKLTKSSSLPVLLGGMTLTIFGKVASVIAVTRTVKLLDRNFDSLEHQVI